LLKGSRYSSSLNCHSSTHKSVKAKFSVLDIFAADCSLQTWVVNEDLHLLLLNAWRL
jgi:hypothetical protein